MTLDAHNKSPASDEQLWWQTAVFYAISPPLFQDTNGDGYGDLQGIIRRLDYLKWLGVDAIWLGPFYPSPMMDLGYDVADHAAVDLRMGTLDTFDRLVSEVHSRDMRIIIDLVPNHTSSAHPWFIESRSSIINPKRDWYVWRSGGPDGSPPSNWLDITGQAAWTYDEATSQFYYHRFLPEQPDLNWRNPEVIEAMQRIMRFWLDRGIDGFRVDAAEYLIEDDLLRDNPLDPKHASGAPGWTQHIFTSDRPETHKALAALREVIDDYPETVMVGEVHLPVARQNQYFGKDRPGFHLPFNFQLISTEPWSNVLIEAAIDQYLVLLDPDVWPNWVLGSHDVPRFATRVGQEQARVGAMLVLTLPGTPFIYYGDELGVPNLHLKKSQRRDTVGLRGGEARDEQRSPMLWDNSDTAGFTAGEPWMPLPKHFRSLSVETQKRDPKSILHLHRAILALRRSEPAFWTRECVPMRGTEDVISFKREIEGTAYQIVLNLGVREREFGIRERASVAISTYLDHNEQIEGALRLRPNEGVILRLQ